MPITNNLYLSGIRKTLPSKVISGYATDLSSTEGWLYDDGTGDPWWQGAGAAPYRWILTADISYAPHGSHMTRLPFYYTGLDVAPGMWVMSVVEPKALKVISVINSTDSSVTCLVEDVDRYNTFKDPTGSGLGAFQIPADLIFFELGDDGLPIMDPLPANALNPGVISSVEARFRVFNPLIENKFFQLNHGFTEGQVLKLNATTQKFEQADGDDVYIVGTVIATGPGPNYFYLSPSTKIITNLLPALPGNVGDAVYLDSVTGELTNVPNGSPIYIKMTDAVSAYTVGTTDLPSTGAGNSTKINNVLVTFNDGAISDIIDSINATTAQHGVIASMSAAPTVLASAGSYPSTTLPASGVLQFKLNGVDTRISGLSINFQDSGDIGFWDIIRAVNEQTAKHGVTAKIDFGLGGKIVLTNESGGAIDFVNIEPVVSSGSVKTISDALGLSELNASGAPTRLKLNRVDGGPITLTDVSGSFTYDTGLKSVSNGAAPIALVVDKSINATGNYIVDNIAARDNLTGIRTGDQVFVKSGITSGEWELYVRTGDAYTKIADHDSAVADASTLSIEVAFDTASPVSLGNVSSGTRIANVTVVVESPFNALATIDVGTVDDHDAVFSTANIDLTVAGTYEGSTSFIYEGAEDGELYVHLNAAGSSSGRARVMVSYL